MKKSEKFPTYYRCQSCGRLLTDRIMSLGICAGHRITYATSGTFFEWLLINFNLWEVINLWIAKREAKKYGY